MSDDVHTCPLVSMLYLMHVEASKDHKLFWDAELAAKQCLNDVTEQRRALSQRKILVQGLLENLRLDTEAASEVRSQATRVLEEISRKEEK